MLIQAVRFVFAPEDGENLEAVFRELRQASRAEAGVITFDVGRSREDPSMFWLCEVYRSPADFDSHKATEHYQRLVVNGIRPLVKQRFANLLAPI